MNYDVYLTETFQKSIKVLKKKYRHVKEDFVRKIKILEKKFHYWRPYSGLEQGNLETKSCQL